MHDSVRKTDRVHERLIEFVAFCCATAYYFVIFLAILKRLIMSNAATGQRKKSDLKKWTEESQMRVAGLFRGCGGRGCRGKLYLLGTGDLAGAAAGPVPGQALSPGH